MTVPAGGARSSAEARRRRQLTDVMAQPRRASLQGQLKAQPKAIDYLKGRGLSGEIAARFGIGYAPDGWQNLEAAFPDYANDATLVDCGLDPRRGEGQALRPLPRPRHVPDPDTRGDIIGFGGRVLGQGEPKYLNSPETPLFEKGRELYGLFQARDAIRDERTA
jgi:DNA primase